MTEETRLPTRIAGVAVPGASLAMTPHIYKKLESTNSHIRVIILHPSQDESAELRCSIQQHVLGSIIGQYESISYTWGSERLECDLCCDDGSVFKITANLHSALSRFRSESQTRCIWADAVCINQTDSEEKSQQIPLMPQIYRWARRVLVWLGSGADGQSETMLSLVRHLGNADDPQISESIRIFFQLPWLGRRWVVQEAVLNPDVVFYCGTSEISWPKLHLAIKSLPDSIWNDTPSREVRKALHKFGELWRTWSYLDQSTENCELFDLLDAFHYLECREAKDKIYALGGLASDVEKSVELMPPKFGQGKIPLVPDYSLSDDEMFRQVALQRMQTGKVFMTLAYAGALRPRDGSRTFPSWAPDFRLSKRWRIMFKDDSKPKSNPSVGLGSNRLITLKAEVDTPHRQYYRNLWNSCVVKNVFPAPKGIEPSSLIQFIRDCLHWMHSIPTLVNFSESAKKITVCDVLLTLAVKYGNEDDELDPSLLDGLLEIEAELKVPSNFLPKTSYQDRLIRWLLVSILDNEDSDGKYLEAMGPYFSKIFRTLSGRSLFASNTLTVSERWGSDEFGGWTHYGISLFGVSPGGIVAGDVIVRFTGVEEGFFFRPQEGGRYKVVGDGYLVVLGPKDQGHEIYSLETDIPLF